MDQIIEKFNRVFYLQKFSNLWLPAGHKNTIIMKFNIMQFFNISLFVHATHRRADKVGSKEKKS